MLSSWQSFPIFEQISNAARGEKCRDECLSLFPEKSVSPPTGREEIQSIVWKKTMTESSPPSFEDFLSVSFSSIHTHTHTHTHTYIYIYIYRERERERES